MILSIHTILSQLTEIQKVVLESIVEDISYLENTLQTVEDKNLVSLARLSITFNYISLETLRNFYCERLSIKRDKTSRNYSWKAFFTYPKHIGKVDRILKGNEYKSNEYIGFESTKDMESFIDTLRIQRNLILHRTSLLNKKHNKKLQTYLNNINHTRIKEIFIKSKNCIEIMSYTMELN